MSKNLKGWENVKIKRTTLQKLRSHKEKTGTSITGFIELAIAEELKRVENSEYFKTKDLKLEQ